MTLQPKAPKDLALAPVAASVDLNLQRLRGKSRAEIDAQFALELDLRSTDDPRDRAQRVLALALRGVDLHGWTAELTSDLSAVRVSGGSVSLDLAVGATVLEYLREPAAVA